MYSAATGLGPKATYLHLRQIGPETVSVVSARNWYPLHSTLALLPRKYHFAGPALLEAAMSDESPYYGPENTALDTALEAYLNTIPGAKARIADVRARFLTALAQSFKSSAFLPNTESLRRMILRNEAVIEHVITGADVLPSTAEEWRFLSLRFALLHSEDLQIELSEAEYA